MSLTNFPNGITSFGSQVMPMLGIGNVYFVCHTSNTDAYDYMVDKFGDQEYADGSRILHPHVGTSSTVTTNGIANALAATVECRNDYVVVMSSDTTYCIDTAALAINKKSVHLVCPAGMGSSVGATNAARVKQKTNLMNLIEISDAGCEVAGLYLQNYNKLSAIVLRTNSYAPLVHHNTFPFGGASTDGAAIITNVHASDSTYDGGSWGGGVEYNLLINSVGAITFANLVYYHSTCTGGRFCHNEIVLGDTITVTVGVNMNGVKGQVNYNTFATGGGASGGTLTHAIYLNPTYYCSAIGNRATVADSLIASGGNADVSWVDNMNAVNGGLIDDQT